MQDAMTTRVNIKSFQVARTLLLATTMLMLRLKTFRVYTPAVLTSRLATSTKALPAMTARACMVAALYPVLAITTHKQVAMMARVHLAVAQHLTHAIMM